MRLKIFWALALLLATGACEDSTSNTADDGGTDDLAAEDTATPDDAVTPDDVAEEADAFACPEVTPEDVTLAHERPLLITVDVNDSSTVGVSTGICVYEPPVEWATRLGESGPCRVLHWLPPVVPTGHDLDTGDITVDIGGTVLTVAAAGTSIPCYRPVSGGPVTTAPAGTTVHVSSTGGTDVPAFDLTTTVPELPTVTEPLDGATITACLPWTVAWTAGDVSGVNVAFRTNLPDGTDFAISCRDVATSPLVVPAELTTLWTTERDGAPCGVRTMNRVVSTTDPAVTLEVTHGTLLAPLIHIERP